LDQVWVQVERQVDNQVMDHIWKEVNENH
jgi:hypothetical protein